MADSQVANLIQLFYEPKAAFTSLKEKPGSWLVLAITMLASLGIFYWYFSTVDFPWMLDRMLSAQPDIKPEAREAMAKIMTRETMTYSTLGGVLLGTPFIFALFALYYFVASKVMGSSIGYGKWFHFSIWVSAPSLLGFPLMALQVASGNGQVGMEELNMLSLNYLFVQAPVTSPWANLLNSVSLPYFWTAFLAYVGMRVWTGASARACAIAAALPYVFMYGGLALKTAILA